MGKKARSLDNGIRKQAFFKKNLKRISVKSENAPRFAPRAAAYTWFQHNEKHVFHPNAFS
jgi:hypothetical protein